MNTQQGFTLKQHIKFLALSLCLSGACVYLDVNYDNFGHGSQELSQISHSDSQNYIFPVMK